MRIIGGRWRGRKLTVAEHPQLRPTPDRVRETLFNWLSPVIRGARCLDCFAGTGALGFEALSRGAADAVFIENDRELAQGLRDQAAVLHADSAEIVHGDALTWMRGTPRRFEIIFVDPPFGSTLATQTCAQILNGGHLAPGGVIYVETARGWRPPEDRFTIQKQGQAGQVQYVLLAVQGEDHETHSVVSRDF